MPIDPGEPSFESAAPWLVGMQKMQEIQNNQQLWKQMQADAALKQAQAKYAPELAQAEFMKKLSDAQVSQQQAQWYGPQAQSAIESQGAQAGHANMETEELKQSLPYKLAKMKFEQQNPLLGLSGVAQQAGAAMYLDNFEKAKKQMQSGNPQDLAIQPQDYGKIAAGVNASGGQAQLAPAQDLGYTPANQGNVAQMLGLGGQQQPQQQQSTAPMLGLGGDQQQVQPQTTAAMLGLGGEQQQQPQTYSDVIKQGIFQDFAQKKARTDYFNKLNKAYGYRMLQGDEKLAMQAQAAGMGYDPVEASNLFSQGYNVADLAQNKGLDPNDLPEPIYPMTAASRTRVQQRQQSISEINTILPDMEQAIAPYSRRFAGYSTKQITEALSGENPDAQAKYLAAKSLMPEMSMMRARAMSGSQIGVELMQDITNASMGNLKAVQSLVSPDVYLKSQEYLDKWINKSVTAANKTNEKALKQISNEEKSYKEQGMDKIYTEDDVMETARANKISTDEARKKIESKGYRKYGGYNNSNSNDMSQQLEELKAMSGGE